jgi:putative spermidine/putrescine transport system permease protein
MREPTALAGDARRNDRAVAPRIERRESAGSRVERVSYYLALATLAGVAVVLLVAPTLVVLVTSFTDSYSLKFPPPAYSTRWYRALFDQSPEIGRAALLSAKVAAAATGLSVVLAGAAALALARRRAAWARVLDSIFMSPMMLPPLALGLALLVVFNLTGRGLSLTTLVIGHVAITTPYILRTTIASYSQLDGALLDSARTLGARPAFAFATVTLPLILPGIAAGAFIAFMVSFDNVAISLFLSDARSVVLPILLWNIIESNLDVRAAAVSGVLIAATVLVALVMERLVGLSRHLR